MYNPIRRYIQGKAHVGRFFYRFGAFVFKSITTMLDNKRLQKQRDDHEDLLIIKDVAYLNDNNKYHLLDIYKRKDSKGDEPVILVIHGGGLMYGDKDLNRFSNMELARRGYTVVAISYPLVPKVTFYDQLHDCFKALGFLDENKKEYNLDMNHLFLWGDSAGGLLSFSITSINYQPELQKVFDIKLDKPYSIKGLGLISSMKAVKRDDNSGIIYRVAITRKQKKLDCYEYLCDMSKTLHKKYMVPAIITTSDLDMIKPDPTILHEIYTKEEVRHIYLDYPSKEHKLEHVFPILYPHYQESQEIFNTADELFKSLL